MAKNINDEYYTPPILAEYCVKKTIEVLGCEPQCYIEPSAGGGVFLDYLPENTVALDINPKDPRVVQGDFLQEVLPYSERLCVIGNPPFGYRNTLAVKFFKKAIEVGDYISYILPISQLNNQQQMYEFDLIYSEDLGLKEYSGVEVHCCLNIYKRPEKGLNPKIKIEFPDGIVYKEFRKGGISTSDQPHDFDWIVSMYGNSMGDTQADIGKYAQEGTLKIPNNLSYKHELLKYLKSFDWKGYRVSVSTPKLQKWVIHKVVSDFIKSLDKEK